MNEEDIKNEIEKLEQEIQNTNYTLVTLISWLQKELGVKQCEHLISMINKDK